MTDYSLTTQNKTKQNKNQKEQVCGDGRCAKKKDLFLIIFRRLGQDTYTEMFSILFLFCTLRGGKSVFAKSFHNVFRIFKFFILNVSKCLAKSNIFVLSWLPLASNRSQLNGSSILHLKFDAFTE